MKLEAKTLENRHVRMEPLAERHKEALRVACAADPATWQDLYIEPFTTFDLTARWALTPRLQLRVEGRNIFGADRQRNIGPNREYHRAGLEVGNTWYLRVNYRL